MDKQTVALINGSPHEKGTTAFALGVIAQTLAEKGADCEIIQIGHMPLRGCIGCGQCLKTSAAEKLKGKNWCVFGKNDGFNEIAQKVHEADGLVIGSPVYYAGINGTLKSFSDRLFYSGSGMFRFKPAAGVVAMRRAGGTAALQTVNQYFEFAEMLITPTMYWSAIHGSDGEQAAQDKEAVQMMQVIGANMAYLLKLRADSDLPVPEPAVKIKTNFIR